MSSVIVARTSLGNVNIDILKKALEVLSFEELETRDYIVDYYGEKHTSWGGDKILGAIFSRELQKGIGVSIDKNGNLIVISHESGPAFEKIKSKVEKTYKLVALIQELQQMGHEISILQDTEKLTVLVSELSSQKITFALDDKGEATFDLDGFSGKTCLEEVKKLTEAIEKRGVNIDVKDIQLKPESQIERPTRQEQRKIQRG